MYKTWTGGQAMGPVASPAAAGPGQVTGIGGWHPTVLYMLVLLAVEIAAVALLSRTVLR